MQKLAIAAPATVTVHVPLAFRRGRGRKIIATPGGSPVRLAADRPPSALVKAIARAFRWRKLLETGVHSTIQDIAAAEKVNASYLGRVLRLTLLAPDIVEGILDGREASTISINAMIKPLPVDWASQRHSLRAACQTLA